MKAGAITHARGHRDYGTGDQPANRAWQCPLHTRADHHNSGSHQPLAVADQPVDSRNPHIVNDVHFIAHNFGGEVRFFRYWDVAGASANHLDYSVSMTRAIPPHAYDAGQREIFGLRADGLYALRHFLVGAR